MLTKHQSNVAVYTYLILCVSICISLVSSCVSKDDLEEIRNRIDAIDNTQIASINKQIASISTSITDLKQVDTDLKGFISKLQESKTELENQMSAVEKRIEAVKEELSTEVSAAKLETLDALETLKNSLEEQLSIVNVKINSLQEKDSELEVRIKALEEYVADDLKKTQEWATATFSTLSQYNETLDAIAGIQVNINSIKQSVDDLESSLNNKIDQGITSALETLRSELTSKSEELDKKISTLEIGMKSWVNEQLSNYYSIAEIDAKFEALRTQYADADNELKSEIENALKELNKQKTELTEAYKKAISDAIEENNGLITDKIQKEIKTINERITGVVEEINSRFTTIENRIKGIETQVAEILSMIQSVIVIPTNSDGSVRISNGTAEFRFEVLPLEAAQKLPELDATSFSLKIVSTIQTKSGDTGGAIPVNKISYKDEEVIIETSGENLPEAFFHGVEGASCRLKITDGYNNVSSSYFSLSPDNTASGFFFRLQALNGEWYEPFLVENNIIHISIPKEINLSALYPVFTSDDVFMSSYGFEITGKQAFDFSDFTKPFTFKQISKDGAEQEWTVNIYDLPVLIMNTPNQQPIDSKEVRVEGTEMAIYYGKTKESLGTAGVKGRGNSTWMQPKKPYNVKLDKKKSILGMPKSKHWVLLSNPYFDQTQLHNDVAFEMARMTDYPWVQSGKFIELILNGKHLGLYYICEKIRIEEGKIDITEIKPSDVSGDALTGGYLLEADIVIKEDFNFKTDYYSSTGDNFVYPLIWNISEPKDNVPQEQIDYIRNQFNHLESLIANDATLLSGDYRDFFDIENAINWWIVSNVCLNEEASRTKNMTVYKDRDSSVGGGKITIGPPWDFDAWTFGNYGIECLWVEHNTWFFHRLLLDPVFVNRLKEKWAVYYLAWKESIPDYIDRQYSYIKNSALRNRVLWPDWYYSGGTYEQYVVGMKNAFLTQLEWMNLKIASYN